MKTRVGTWLVATAVAIVVMAAPTSSHACSRLPSSPTLLEPVFEAPDHVIESTRVSLACVPRGIDAACDLEVRYRVRNRGKAPAHSRAMIIASGFEPRVTVDSARGPIPIPLEATKIDRRLVREVDCDERMFYGRGSFAFAFDVALAAGESRELVVRGAVVLRKLFALVGGYGDCNTDEGVQRRHPFLSSGRSAGWFGFQYVMGTNREIEPSSKLALFVRHPRAWEAELYRSGDSFPESTKHADGDDVREEIVAGFDRDHQVVHIAMNVERGSIFNGGPYAGAHWSFAPDGGALFRAGYEIASPPWLLESVSVESDLRRRLVLVPAVEAVTNTGLVFGLGLGVPIRLRPELQIGGRIQASASVGFFTLRGAFDAYPATSLLPSVVEGSLGPQLSF